MLRRRNDIFLVAGALLLALVIWLGVLLSRSGGAYAVVSVDGCEVSRYPLPQNTEVVIGDGDTYNLLIIQDGKAWVSKASCPDGLCVTQGTVEYSGQSIICLPNRVTVEILGGKSSEIDEVSR